MRAFPGTESPMRRMAFLAVGVISMGVFLGSSGAVAGTSACKAVSGIIIDASTGSVQMTTANGRCRTTAKIKPRQPASETRRWIAGRAASVVVTKPAATARPQHRCDQELADFWSAGFYRIDGADYWLSQVHTVDFAGDGRIDNVGFRLRPREGEDLVLMYFAAPGQLSAKAIEALALVDDSVIERLCFGQLAFEMPAGGVEKTSGIKPFEIPNLAGEMAGSGKKPPPATAETASSGVWIGLASGAPIGLAVGGFGAFMMRRRRNRKPVEEEKTEEEDDWLNG